MFQQPELAVLSLKLKLSLIQVILWTPNEEKQEKMINSLIHKYIDDLWLYIVGFITYYLFLGDFPGILNR